MVTLEHSKRFIAVGFPMNKEINIYAILEWARIEKGIHAHMFRQTGRLGVKWGFIIQSVENGDYLYISPSEEEVRLKYPDKEEEMLTYLVEHLEDLSRTDRLRRQNKNKIINRASSSKM